MNGRVLTRQGRNFPRNTTSPHGVQKDTDTRQRERRQAREERCEMRKSRGA